MIDVYQGTLGKTVTYTVFLLLDDILVLKMGQLFVKDTGQGQTVLNVCQGTLGTTVIYTVFLFQGSFLVLKMEQISAKDTGQE